jgi:hypothetical protein
MIARLWKLFAATLASVAVLAPTMSAADVGEVQMCVPLQQIDDSRVIDDKTILLRMVIGSPYRRVDLAHNCPGLKMAGNFMSATSISQLCRLDVVRVVQEPMGSQCIIERIVVIDEAEAKELLAARRKR